MTDPVTVYLGIGTNLVREDGIPLVAEIPYEIFAPCKDSEAVSEQSSLDDFDQALILYVDARPADDFAIEHARDALNVPYSALFGASEEDVVEVVKEFEGGGYDRIVTYGMFDDGSGEKVDFGKSLAEQLIDAKLKPVKHVEGGLETLKKQGVETVKADGGQTR